MSAAIITDAPPTSDLLQMFSLESSGDLFLGKNSVLSGSDLEVVSDIINSSLNSLSSSFKSDNPTLLRRDLETSSS